MLFYLRLVVNTLYLWMISSWCIPMFLCCYSSDEPVQRCKDKSERTHFSEELEVSVGVHQGSFLSPLLFAIVIIAATNEIKEGTL